MVSTAAGAVRAYATATHFGPTVAVTAFTAVLALTSGAGLRTLLICVVVPPVIYNRDRRGLHDLIAGTVTVRR